MSVTEARFRAATVDEVSYAQGGICWKIVTTPWQLFMKTWGTASLLWKGPNSYAWDTPLPLKLLHNFQWYFGLNVERGFIHDLPTFLFNNWHFIDGEEKVFDAFFKEHRDGEIFANSRSFKAIHEILVKTFPESNISFEDFILTCSPAKSKTYHDLLVKMLNGEKLRQSLSIVQDEIKLTLARWCRMSEAGEWINATQELRIFTSNVITRVLLGQKYGNPNLTDAINFLNNYLVKYFVKKNTVEDDKALTKALNLFNKAVQEVLINLLNVPIFNESTKKEPLSIKQMQAMIFIIFFAGQETTAALMTYTIWKLSIDSKQQQTFHNQIQENFKSSQEHSDHIKKIQSLFTSSIREFPPAFGLSRSLKVDACLEYKLRGETSSRKMVMCKGETITARMIKASESQSTQDQNFFFFGGGPHHCPGEQMAKMEFNEFFLSLLADYKITARYKHEIEKIGRVTLQLNEDVFIRIEKLNTQYSIA